MKTSHDPVPSRPLPSHRFERPLALGMAVLVFWVWAAADRGAGFGGLGSAALPGLPNTGGWVSLLSILGLVALNALFVMGETALDALRGVYAKPGRDATTEQVRRLQVLVDQRTRLSAACAVGSQGGRLALVLASLALAVGLSQWGQQEHGWSSDFSTLLFAAAAVATPVVLLNMVLGELAPQSFASLHPQAVALRLYRFLRATGIFLSPLAALVLLVANVVTRRFGGHASLPLANQAEAEIKTLVESAQETGEIEVDEKELLHSVFEFTDTVAREVMTPRVDLDAMSINSDPAEVVKVVVESGHSRIPLYEETDDQIVGIVHAKDLLSAMLAGGETVSLRALMRPALFVPENKNLHELMSEMRTSRSQMAVVQDEFGGTAGIVTIEDIVEELVGDIVDEYDVEEPEVTEVDGGFLVDGKTDLDDVAALLDSEIECEEFDTVGGYVFGLFGRQPKRDEFVDAEGLRFMVAETDGRRILKLRVERLERPASLEDEEAEG